MIPSHHDPDVLARRLGEALAARPGPTALVVQHLILLPRLLDVVAAAGLRVPHDLTVVLVGSLPDELGVRHLPRIDLPVAEMSTAVARLAIDAIGPGLDDRSPTARKPLAAGASRMPPGTPHHVIQPRMAGPAVAPPSPG